MAEKKTIDDLTIMDDYMFAQVMRKTEHIKPLLEQILRIEIADLRLIEPQKTEKEGYESKGARLDLFVTDSAGAVYNVEVQTTDNRDLPKRMRYYQSILDMSILTPGMNYKSLKESFVIFICSYDEFGCGRCVYTFENTCREEPGLVFGDGALKVVVNTRGDKGGVGEDLRESLLYMENGRITGSYSQELDDAVKAIKSSEERRLEYMMLVTRDNEMRAQGREEGWAEGREEGWAEGQDEVAALMERLFALGRVDDARRAASDKAYRKRLLEETGVARNLKMESPSK